MNRIAVAEELVKIAELLTGADKTAVLGRKDLDFLVSMMKSTGVASNAKFVNAMIGWLKGQNPLFDEDRFKDALS